MGKPDLALAAALLAFTFGLAPRSDEPVVVFCRAESLYRMGSFARSAEWFELLVLLLVLVLVLPDEFVLLLLRSLLSVLVVVLVAVRVVVTVLPPRATTESSACALSEKASEMAVTSKVLFIRFPLWV